MTKYINHTETYSYSSHETNYVQLVWEELLLPPSFFCSSSCLILITQDQEEIRGFPLYPLTNWTTLCMVSWLHFRLQQSHH